MRRSAGPLCAIVLLGFGGAAEAATSWVNDFEAPNLMGINLPTAQRGLLPVPLTTADISGGALNMTFFDSPDYWQPQITNAPTSMALDRSKHYVIRIELEAESDTMNGLLVRLRWDDGPGDGLAGFNTTEQVTFTLYPNVGPRTFTFYTNDTTTWPGFAHFGKDAGDGDVQYWRLAPGAAYPTPANLDGHVVKLHHIGFTEYSTEPEPLVIASYFPAETTREVSQQSGIWRLFDFFTSTDQYEVQYSGDNYVTTDKKEVANTFYPRIGLFDAVDRKVIEYHVLQAKASGVDGFAFEIAVPGSTQFPEHSNDVMYAMSLFVEEMRFEFQIGLELLNDSYGPWRSDDFPTPFPDRTAMLTQLKLDMKQWLDDIYGGRRSGIWVAGRPVVLFYSPTPNQPTGVDPLDSLLGPDDFDEIKDYLHANGWGAPSASPLLDPVFLGRDTYWMGALRGRIEGSFPWTSVSHPSGVSEWPWGLFHTRSTIVSTYVAAYYAGCMNWASQGPMDYFMGPALRGFDDHKGHSWNTLDVKRYIASDRGETLDDTFDAFENQSATGTPLCFVVEWPEYKEATGVDPNREQGYAHMEALASRIWTWRGHPEKYSPTLLRLPERLHAVRGTIDLLLKAGYLATDAEIASVTAAADTASRAIHNLLEDDAVAALDAAEASARDLVGGLTTTWIDLGWKYGAPDGLAPVYPTSFVPISVDSKDGIPFTPPVNQPNNANRTVEFAITDATAKAAMNDGYFVGRLRIEYLDDEKNWIYTGTDNATPAVYKNALAKALAQFLAKDSGQWRRAEHDLVNVDFHSGLPNAGGDLEVQERRRTSSSTHASAIHAVRILGTAYRKP